MCSALSSSWLFRLTILPESITGRYREHKGGGSKWSSTIAGLRHSGFRNQSRDTPLVTSKKWRRVVSTIHSGFIRPIRFQRMTIPDSFALQSGGRYPTRTDSGFYATLVFKTSALAIQPIFQSGHPDRTCTCNHGFRQISLGN
jgi:hypothetical protein